MSKLDEIKIDLNRKLNEQRQRSEARLQAERESLRAQILRNFQSAPPADLERRTAGVVAGWRQPSQSVPVNALLDISSSSQLRQLDEAFVASFNLASYYPPDLLYYPTVYCETLEEFFTPMLEQMDASPEMRTEELARRVSEAQEFARVRGGGILGYNLPGRGAYLNGWLFAFQGGISPRQAFSHPDIKPHILETTAHEKLGHGFLAVYSALGQAKTRLGLSQMDIARQFGLRTSDDPASSLRAEQAGLLFLASQLVEEGWATWVEACMARSFPGGGAGRRYDLGVVRDLIKSLPRNFPERAETQKALNGVICNLFDAQASDIGSLHQAVMVLEMIGSGALDDYIFSALGQPLRYVFGDLLACQAEVNLGPACVPYAALIACSVNFDPASTSLSDLRDRLARDPRVHPDARFAALSRLKLEQKNDVRALAGRATGELSFSVPKELK